MLKQLKQLVGDSMIYGISGVVTRMIGIFLIPVYTRIFVPEDYGIINLINTTFYLLALIILCALDNAAGRWFYDSKEPSDHKNTFGSWIWFQLMISVLVAIIVIIMSPYLVQRFFEKAGKPIYFILPAICLVANIMPAVITNWYRVHRRAVATVLFTFSQTLLTICLTIYFVIFLKWHITGVFAALTISSVVFSVVAIQQMNGWLAFKYFSKERLLIMLKFSLPYIPASLAFWMLNSTDAYFLAYFKDKTEVGLFGIGASLAAGMGLFTVAFQQAWGPFAFSIMNDENAKEVYANVFLLFGYFMGFLAALLMLFAPELLLMLTSPAYYSAAWVGGILGYNLVLIGFTYIAIIGLSIVKITSPYGIAMLSAAGLTVILDILLIPSLGKEGSAIATVLAQLLVPAYLFYRGHKVYPIPYKFKEVIIVILLMAAIAAGVRFIEFDNLKLQVSIKILTALVLMIFVFIANKTKLLKIINKIKSKNVNA